MKKNKIIRRTIWLLCLLDFVCGCEKNPELVCSGQEDCPKCYKCINGTCTLDPKDPECITEEYRCSEDGCGAQAQKRICRDGECEAWQTIKECGSQESCWAKETAAGCELGTNCTVEEYRCDAVTCGAQAQKRTCTGDDCTQWQTFDRCGAQSVCWANETGAGCTECENGCESGECLQCSSGPCCENGKYSPITKVCDTGTDLLCVGLGCGADVFQQHWEMYCSGTSSDCVGEKVKSGELEAYEDCTTDAVCVDNGAGMVECSHCEYGCLTDRCMQCNQGDCCDDNGTIKNNTEVCDSGASYQCSGFGCGDDVQIQVWIKYCDGQTADCRSDPIFSDWEVDTDCETGAICQEQQGRKPICSYCESVCFEGECKDCVPGSGSCCDEQGLFKDENEICAQGTSYQCYGMGCGDDLQKRTWTKFCDGKSSTCDAESVPDSDWADWDSCSPIQSCESDGMTYATCIDVAPQCGLDNLKVMATDRQQYDQFGTSVAVSGNVAIIGAPYWNMDEDDLERNAGTAYVFHIEDGTWVEKQKLTTNEEEGGDEYGWSVSIDGDIAIIGAPFKDGGDEGSIKNTGAAYIFQIENGQWLRKQKLIPSDAQAYDCFGDSVSISGDIAIVGAPEEDGGDGDPFSNTGAAYIFQLENGVWMEKQKLIAPDVQRGNVFGLSVSIDKDLVIVGAFDAAYIFQKEYGQWIPKHKLTGKDAMSGDGFGYSVSINGNFAIVGVFRANEAAYIFQLINGIWVEKQRFTSPDSQSGIRFGASVSIDGDIAIIGAPYGDAGEEYPLRGTGVAYVFQLKNGVWVVKQKITAPDAYKSDEFGLSVSISGDVAIIGAPFVDGGSGFHINEAGAAYIYPL